MHPWEPGLIRSRLLGLGQIALTDRFEAAVSEEGGRPILSHKTDGRCQMLDMDGPTGPGCSVHANAGLPALPPACRNFPRSVGQTPTGVEVAFQLNCPTAAKIVARHPEPFSWVTIPGEEWPYAATFFVDETIAWTPNVSKSFAEVDATREAWWARLAEADEVIGTLGALMIRPSEPDDPRLFGLDALPRDLGKTASDPALDHLGRLGTRGAYYRAERGRLGRKLARDIDMGALGAAAQAQRASFFCALGLSIQTAGVHDKPPTLERLSMAAWQGLCAVWLFETLRQEDAVDELDALQDAINATANLTRA
jgi:hypothetical protein